jgi:uroporphyrin-3 C-methyltransferase
VVAAVALALLAWQWVETRLRLADVQTELTRRLGEDDAVAKETRAIVRLGQDSLQSLQAKLGVLEAKLAESQGQQLALEAMYQELSRSRDERLLAEIEQSVSIAAQQLQLAGNVQAALIALEGADTRLARAGRPQFIGVRKLLARDIAVLRALPAADIPGIAVRLEGVIAGVDSLPLGFEQRPKAAAASAKASRSPADASFWQALAADVLADTRDLIRIERIDRPDPGMLSPSQSFFLRENLKLRLVNAKLALLSRDGRSFREDVRQARDWLERYFDTTAKPVLTDLATLKTLAVADMAQELPTLGETLAALRNMLLARERETPPPPGPRPRGGGDRGSAAPGAASGSLTSPALSHGDSLRSGRPSGGAK